ASDTAMHAASAIHVAITAERQAAFMVLSPCLVALLVLILPAGWDIVVVESLVENAQKAIISLREIVRLAERDGYTTGSSPPAPAARRWTCPGAGGTCDRR